MSKRPDQASGGTALLRKGTLIAGMMMGVVVLAGCAGRPQYPVDGSPPRSDGRGRDDGGETEQMRASSEKNNDWSDAITAPLEDFNLRRQDIPVILANAVERPYDLSGLETCDSIAGEVIQLDALLGRDFDEPPLPKDDRTMREKGKEFANEQAVGAVRGASRGLVPFRGAIRYFSGADKHQKQLDNAIQAGKVRRAYLKAIGMNKNCAPPAAPSWFRPRVYVQTYVQPQRPASQTPAPAPKQRTGRKLQ